MNRCNPIERIEDSIYNKDCNDGLQCPNERRVLHRTLPSCLPPSSQIAGCLVLSGSSAGGQAQEIGVDLGNRVGGLGFDAHHPRTDSRPFYLRNRRSDGIV